MKTRVEPEHFNLTETLHSLFTHLFFISIFRTCPELKFLSILKEDTFRYKIHGKVKSTVSATSFPVTKQAFTLQNRDHFSASRLPTLNFRAKEC